MKKIIKRIGLFFINSMVGLIRIRWKISDNLRDKGLVTPENIIRYDNLSYGKHGKWNLLDIYHTKEVADCQPTIINVHGGAWVYGTKENYQYYCMELAQRGFTVVNFNYRLLPEHPYPSALEDMNQMFYFLKEQAEKYKIDIDNLFVVGDSAGAQIVSQYLTVLTNVSYARMFDFVLPELKVRAVALNCGIYDVKKMISQIPDNMDFMKYMTQKFPASFVMTAYHDRLKKFAKPMYEHLQKIGVESRLKIYGSKRQKEIAHVFHVNINLPEAVICNDEECAFFKSYIERKAET